MKPSRVVAITAACAAAVAMSVAAPAFADNGKSAYGCSSPYQLVTWDNQSAQLFYVDGPLKGQPEPRTQAGLAHDVFTSAQLLHVLIAIDNNGDHLVCEKPPNGFDMGTTKRLDYVNLVDDKVLS